MTVLLLESIFDLFFIVYAGEVWVPGLYFTEKHTQIIFSGEPSLYQCTPLLPLFSSHSRKVTLLSRLLENLSWKMKSLFVSWRWDRRNIFHEYLANIEKFPLWTCLPPNSNIFQNLMFSTSFVCTKLTQFKNVGK